MPEDTQDRMLEHVPSKFPDRMPKEMPISTQGGLLKVSSDMIWKNPTENPKLIRCASVFFAPWPFM